MKTLYLECNMGAAGDMLMAALLELHPDRQDFLKRLNGIGITNVSVSAEPSVKCGITGTHISVAINGHEEHTHSNDHEHVHTHQRHKHDDPKYDGHTHSGNGHHHNSYHDIEHLIGHLSVSDSVKKNALAVYKSIANAESHVHGVSVHQVHFHEVGELDAIADIVGVCMLIEELAPELILASPINVGSGHVRCAHGILPVPAPATAYLLKDIPFYNDSICGELCTPTGAALLKHFVKEFGKMPVIAVDCIGYGMGSKDFEKTNCVRAYMGDSDNSHEEVIEFVCNLDDMTPEAVAFAGQLLFDEGALDVFTTSIGMKKGRTGLSLTCMCRVNERDKMLALIFKHTTTLGIREYVSRRYVLHKEQSEIETEWGAVRVKTSYGFGVRKSKPEYEDVAKIAHESGLSIADVLSAIQRLM